MPGKAGTARNPRGARATAAAQAVKASAAAAAALAVAALGVGRGVAAGQDAMQPGQWEMAVQVTSVEIPGARPEVQEQVRSQIGQPQTNQECLTPERVRNPLQQMREMMSQGQAASCRFTSEVFGGGVIRIGATCPGPSGQGTEGQVLMEGGFTGTTLQATLTLNVEGPNPALSGSTGMRMTADIRGRRIGECPATPAPPATGEPAPEPPPPPRP
jgi:hypothetical protein